MDPITLEIIRNRLTTISDEMESTLLRTAYSPIVKEGLDASSAIFDIKGQTIAQAAAIPIHLGCLIPAVNRIIDLWSPEEMKEGDAYILNDPYNGGTHLPDIVIVMPVFNNGKIFSLVTTMCHHQEMGGMVPGSLPPNSTELFQEGIRIPPMQFMENNKIITPIKKIIEANVRIPETVLGDLNAQLSALHIGKRRLTNMAEDIGLNNLTQAIETVLDKSEQLTKKRIQNIPDGKYEFIDYLDDDGINQGVNIPIKITTFIEQDHIHVDFSGTSPQLAGPYNCVPSSTLSAVYYVIRAVTGSDIPNNSGCFRSITINMPEGTLVNPFFPAPVNSRTASVKRITDALIGCLIQATPDKLPAASSGQLLVMNFGGFDPYYNQTYITSELGVGGTGGRPNKDGVNSIDTDATNCMNIPAEAIEMDSPIRIKKWKLWKDSGGPGKWRGGLGVEKVFELTRGEATVTYRGERHTTRAWGINGGYASPFSKSYIIRSDGYKEKMNSKQAVHLNTGDQLHVFISGGGGYGNPLDRAIKDVENDVKNSNISKSSSEKIYGIVWKENEEVDIKLTKKKRKQLLEERGEKRNSKLFERGGESL